MDFTEFSYRLLLLFLPGIVCLQVLDHLTEHRKRQAPEVALNSFILGILSYVVLALFTSALSIRETDDGILIPWNNTTILDSSARELPARQIAYATIVGIGLGALLGAAKNYSWTLRIARWLRVTKKFGESSVWLFALNSPSIKWATIRDLDQRRMYQGYIRAYNHAEDENERDLLLTDVRVHDEVTGEKLYETQCMYFCITSKSQIVELHTQD